MRLVERYTGDQAMRIRCTKCGAEKVIDPGDISNEDMYPCPADCPGYAEHKFWQADRCPGCKRLGFYDKRLDYCCSRRCQLQAEYVRSLEAA